MSRRSYDSSAHERRISKNRVTDEELFDYALRVAVLSYLLVPKVLNNPNKNPKPDESRERGLSQLSALSTFSLGELFRDGSKGVKFPEKMIKVLEQKLQDIAMGRDPAYSDQFVRRTMARFYGEFTDNSFKRQMKENRKIEELILKFATIATGVLKKEPTLAGDGWKIELNNQIAQFIKLLRECLRNVHHVSPELVARLDGYTAKLAPALAAAQQATSQSDSGYDSGTSRDSFQAPTISYNIADMPLVKVVAKLFKIPDHAIQTEVDRIRQQTVTEKAALKDLKTCLKNIAAGASFPGRRDDFATDAAWNQWKTLETTHLQQMIVGMIKTNPNLTRSNDRTRASAADLHRSSSGYSNYDSQTLNAANRHPSVGSRHSLFDVNDEITVGPGLDDDDGVQDDDVQVGHNFTYIPPNPRKYYRRLVEYCLVADLEVMMSPEVDDNDEVSLGILSQPHLELISECALRWRIGHPYRSVCFLDLVRQFYERNDVPMECVPEALNSMGKVMQESDPDFWPTQDVDLLASSYASLFNIFLSCLYHAMDAIPNLKPADLKAYLSILEHVRDSGFLARFDVDVEVRLNDVQDKAKSVTAEWYETKMQEYQGRPGVNRALPLLLVTEDIEKTTKLLDKRFPDPLLGKVDITSLFLEVAVPHLITDLQNSQKRLFESSMNGPTPDVPIQDIFTLYRRIKLMMSMYKAFVPLAALEFNLAAFFEPYVKQWLLNTDATTGQWVENAISADKFEAEGVEGHSSSIQDLFDSLRSPVSFLQNLEWEDDYYNARFFTKLSKTISKAIDQYCRSVETLFLDEMYPRPTDYIQPQKSSAWIERAKQLAAMGEKRVEPFNFLSQSCVKLNNVEAALKLLDNIQSQMQADQLAEIARTAAPPVPEKVERDKFLFTVKIVIAEELVPHESSANARLDTFVTLSDEEGNRVAKTRTVYETDTPRWEESFDLSVDKALWLMVSVRDRSLIGKHDTLGRAYLCLDPARFGDLMSHDLWMELDTSGRILVRVSMEGERDDIQFYFGRAFRSLKRAEGDMIRIFIEKMSPFIRQCLSRNIVKGLIKTREQQGLDYNKALGGVTAFYRNALGSSASEVQVPLPATEKPRQRPEDLTDLEIEEAISPLFDYFESNLQTLNTYLSDTTKEKVMAKLWKEILGVIEWLLIPPLSDQPSDLKPLRDKEVDIVFKWLKFLRDYFYAGGEGPIPVEMLQNQKYRDILSIRLYYDWDTDALMEECVRMMQQTLRSAPTIKKRAKSVYQQRNLGTIRQRKKEKKKDESEGTSEETILRILRMRPHTKDFISQQLQIMTQMRKEQELRAQQEEKRNSSKKSNRIAEIPPVPSLPPLPEKS
ncbi:cytoplasm protein [Coprinopsis marcescibilis]|uniref:Cytoplasm protein n=1 Tax=Coprinopsis marcescibilis TaxID=230819 RepID=A0A5C3KWP2_COPMA|nr:cytoplasm protein [Coprinopsis marcescibilis]